MAGRVTAALAAVCVGLLIGVVGYDIAQAQDASMGSHLGDYKESGLPLGGGTVTGTATFAGQVVFQNTTTVLDNALFRWGSVGDTRMRWSTVQTPDAFLIAPGNDSRVIAIVESGDEGTDFVTNVNAGSAMTDPTLCIWSADETAAATDALCMRHDQTNAVVSSLGGSVVVEPANDNLIVRESGGVAGTDEVRIIHNGTEGYIDTLSGDLNHRATTGIINFAAVSAGFGAETQFKSVSEFVQFAANPGDASKTLTATIPDGAVLLGVTGRVFTTGTNCAGFSIGDGSDVDLWGANIAVASGTQFTAADATAAVAAPVLSATSVVLTGTDGAGTPANCFDLDVRVNLSYFIATAPTG